MRAAGLDVGSRSIALVVLEGGEAVLTRIEETTHDPVSRCRSLIEGVGHDALVATGYGRHLIASHWPCDVVSEIRAVSLGARRVAPSCRTVLDIGGQDTKAVTLDGRGKVRKFEMNEKCAAGTGRFLEVMATALSYSLDDFASAASSAPQAADINSMCTVFAESEVVSMVARGTDRDEVALGIHHAVARRTLAMLGRVRVEPEVLFVGGVALNPCIRSLIASGLGHELRVPSSPQTVAALGASLVATGMHD